VIPRTAVNAIVAEQNFQLSGYTDSDTIARLGRQLNADFVVSGHIRRLGNRNLIITTIVDVESFELLAGDYRQYRNIQEVQELLPAISQKMIVAGRRDSSVLPKLAVAPFRVTNRGINEQDAEVLAQIFSVEITNTGKYVVLPRTATMQAALRELEYQMSGFTAEEEAKALGRAANADYVLSAEVRSLGSVNMFTAQILLVEDGRLLDGDRREYQTAADGIHLMPELARVLTDRAGF
jgi:TolB-like protein